MGWLDDPHPDEALVRDRLRQTRYIATLLEAVEVNVSLFLHQAPDEALPVVREADQRMSR